MRFLKFILVFSLFFLSNVCAKETIGIILNTENNIRIPFISLYATIEDKTLKIAESNAFGAFYSDDFSYKKQPFAVIHNDYILDKISYRISKIDTIYIFLQTKKTRIYDLHNEINIEAKTKKITLPTMDYYGIHYAISKSHVVRQPLPTNTFELSELLFANESDIKFSSVQKHVKTNENIQIHYAVIPNLQQQNMSSLQFKIETPMFYNQSQEKNVALYFDESASMQNKTNFGKIDKTILQSHILRKVKTEYWYFSEKIEKQANSTVSSFDKVKLLDIIRHAKNENTIAIYTDEDFLLQQFEINAIKEKIKNKRLTIYVFVVSSGFPFTTATIESLRNIGVNFRFVTGNSQLRTTVYSFLQMNDFVVAQQIKAQLLWNRNVVKSFKIKGFDSLRDYESEATFPIQHLYNNQVFSFEYEIETQNKDKHLATLQLQYSNAKNEPRMYQFKIE